MRDMCLIKMEEKDVGLIVLFVVMVAAVMAGIFAMDTLKVNIGA